MQGRKDVIATLLIEPQLEQYDTFFDRPWAEALFERTPAQLADAVSNLGRVALGVAGIATGRTELLRELTVDRLHEPYRAQIYPELPRIVTAARDAGAIGACLSGAGSTILAFADQVSTITRIEAAYRAASADLDLAGRILVVAPRNHGARVVP